MASRQTISEDWEDVAEDSLSVISLDSSTSQPDDPAQEKINKKTSVTADEKTPSTDKINAKQDLEETREDKGKGIATQQDLDETYEEDKEDGIAIQSSAYPFTTDATYAEYLYQDQDDDDDAEEANPRVLQSTLESLVEILDETICFQVPNTIYTANGRNPFDVCRRIRGQVRELGPILSGYAQAMSSEVSVRDLPIDPSLHAWLSSVRVKALSLQAEARNSLGKHIYSLEPNQPFSQILQDLEELEDKMEGFLPIMQVDFNEFQTQFMNLPIASTTVPLSSGRSTTTRTTTTTTTVTQLPHRSAPIRIPSPPACRPSSPTNPRPHPQLAVKLPHLRQELYTLKDTISQAAGRLRHVHNISPQGSDEQASSFEMAARLEALNIGLSHMLSNNGSEWIDWSLSGGMSYAEFLALEIDVVVGLNQQLGYVLKLEPDYRYMADSEYKMFLDGGHHEKQQRQRHERLIEKLKEGGPSPSVPLVREVRERLDSSGDDATQKGTEKGAEPDKEKEEGKEQEKEVKKENVDETEDESDKKKTDVDDGGKEGRVDTDTIPKDAMDELKSLIEIMEMVFKVQRKSEKGKGDARLEEPKVDYQIRERAVPDGELAEMGDPIQGSLRVHENGW